jgi:hypothetical protein
MVTQEFFQVIKLRSAKFVGWSDCVLRALFQVDRSEEIKFKLEKLNIESEITLPPRISCQVICGNTDIRVSKFTLGSV